MHTTATDLPAILTIDTTPARSPRGPYSEHLQNISHLARAGTACAGTACALSLTVVTLTIYCCIKRDADNASNSCT